MTATTTIECENCEDIARSFQDGDLFVAHVRAVHPEEFGEADEAAKAPSGANAPYKIVPAGKKFAVVNNAGETKATFDTRAKAADYLQALYANVKGAQKRANKVPFTGKAKNRVPAKKAATAKASADKAHDCQTCDRSFLSRSALADHAEAVHAPLTIQREMADKADGEPTFSDIEEMVREAVREKYYEPGDYRATPVVESVWAYVRDLSVSWVVFCVESGGDDTLYQASYSILDGKVNLGEPVEVVRKTVYEPVKKES